jgi:hypothetical protein
MTSLSSKQHEDLLKELDRIKEKACLGFELEVYWLPGFVKRSKEGKELRGEVLGTKIFVYDSDFEEAMQTLRHEFAEYLVDQAVDPYRKLVNLLFDHFQDQAYFVKDKTAKALTNLFDDD